MAAGALDLLRDPDLPIRHVGQWTLVWWRFRAHRLALIAGVVVMGAAVLAVIGPLLVPPLQVNATLPPSALNRPPHLGAVPWYLVLGTDANGSPVLSYVLLGAQATLEIGVFGALLATAVGIVVGTAAGYGGRLLDAVLMRIADTFLAVPVLPFLVVLSLFLLQRDLTSYVVLFGVAGWAGIARLVRSYVLSLRERDFVAAARALGVSASGVIVRHLLPNALDVLLVSFTLNVSAYIVAEASLEFLSAGPAAVTWGHELALSYYTGGILSGYWWQIVFPGAALVATALAVNFIGDGVRDALDVLAPVAARRTRGRRRLPRPLAGLGRHVPRRRMPGAKARAARSAVPAAHADVIQAARQPLPWPVQILPMVALLLAMGAAVLLGSSPLAYAPNYPAPTTYASFDGITGYAAAPSESGGWDVLVADGAGGIVYRHVGVGRSRTIQIVRAGTASEPAVADDRGAVVGTWVAADGSVLRAARLLGGRARVTTLTPPGGAVDHPALTTGQQEVDVVFQWAPVHGPAGLYLIRDLSGSARGRPIRLPGTSGGDLLPQVAHEGNGDLVVLDLEAHGHGTWQIVARRYTGTGRSRGSPVDLGQAGYVQLRPSTLIPIPTAVPPSWPIAVTEAADGSVWAAWESGSEEVVPDGPVQGGFQVEAAHWSARGLFLLPPTVIDPIGEASAGFALAASGSTEHIFHTYPARVVMRRLQGSQLLDDPTQVTGTSTILIDEGFDAAGRLRRFERVAYDGGGNAADPTVTVRRQGIDLLWGRERAQSTVLEGTHQVPARPPDLATRLGINIGNVWVNLLLVVLGSLVGAVVLTGANALLVVAALLIWLPISRLPARIRWSVYLAVLVAGLVWLFLPAGGPPAYVLLLPAFAAPLGAVVVVGAGVMTAWANRVLLRGWETLPRAVGTAVMAVYVVAAMGMLVLIQHQITRI